MKFQSPWMGRVSGSAGNMTGCKMYDSNVMRAKAFEVANPNTAAQQVQRNYFKDLTELTNTVSVEQLRTLFPSMPKKMSRRSALAKQLALSVAMDGAVKVVDYADIDTLGNAQSMDFGETSCTNSTGTITVGLAAAVKALTYYADNYMGVCVVNDTKGDLFFPDTNVNVSTGSLSFSAPSGWETTDTIHAIPFIMKEKKGESSAAVAFGTLGIVTRPARQGRNPQG